MKITNLDISKFRAFKQLNLDGFSRINILLGENNCGKTSVLEALFFLQEYQIPIWL